MPPERRWVCRSCPAGCHHISLDQTKPRVFEKPCIRYTASFTAGAIIPETRTARFEELV